MQDATHKTAAEIAEMGDLDRRLTALLRGRFYREKSKSANSGGSQRRP